MMSRYDRFGRVGNGSDLQMQQANKLEVEYCGERIKLAPSDQLSFGRAADLCIDENEYMHRIVGAFTNKFGRWWLVNSGSRIAIQIHSKDDLSKATVMPGNDYALPGGRTAIGFTAGPTSYEIEVHLEQQHPPVMSDAHDTISVADIHMTLMQQQALLALAEHKLRNPTAPLQIPTNKEAAHRLGWGLTKFNRKLDNICDKLTREGVRGLKAGRGNLATGRRQLLVEHAISTGIIDQTMLPLLEEPS